jgi:hypothetical protein
MNIRIHGAILTMDSMANSRGDKALAAALTEAAAVYKRHGRLSSALAELDARRQNASGRERELGDWVCDWLRGVESGSPPRG